MSKTVEPLKYHGPGWYLEFEEGWYQFSYHVWAPQTQADVDRQGGLNPPRDHWSASYDKGFITSDDEYEEADTAFWNGDSFEEVTQDFPAEIKRAFKKEVEA